jgi:hypothetical protein
MSLDRRRVLLLHPEDDPACGPWNHEQWDRVVDLGTAGEQTRTRWSGLFDCPVESIPKFEINEFAKVRAALSSGLGYVIDDYGLDWWELISIRVHEQLALVIRLRKLAEQLDASDEVCVSRPGPHSAILSLALNRNVRCFRERTPSLGKTRRLIRTARKLSFTQLLEIAGDKYDAGYRIRRFAARRQERFSGPVVLLPVAQGNAARTAVSYAAMLPEEKFLLVATRQSGLTAECSSNVSAVKLASYGGGQQSQREFRQILRSWRKAEYTLVHTPEVSVLMRAGVLFGLAKTLRDGLAIRDAWLGVFRQERVSAVLCTDDTNPYTHIPLLIARQRGLPTIACHHGALDGAHLVKRSHADLVLAKGHMEKDYLVNTCGVTEEKIEVGAPSQHQRINTEAQHPKSSIVFFSEPYALDGGRCREFYRELLPPLADLASRMNLNLVVKLHPMESERERRNFVNAALLPPQVESVQIVAGPLSDELLDMASFAVTVQSTAAVDCAIRGIPVFLCKWLDYSHYGYVDQFIRYRAGVPLQSSAEIANIRDMLKNFPVPMVNNFWQTISSERLQQLLTGSFKMAVAV